MPFVPISLDDYVTQSVASSPGAQRSEVAARVRRALADFKAGARCHCGARIWVIGSAEVGQACFTCITGESTPNEVYELAEACVR